YLPGPNGYDAFYGRDDLGTTIFPRYTRLSSGTLVSGYVAAPGSYGATCDPLAAPNVACINGDYRCGGPGSNVSSGQCRCRYGVSIYDPNASIFFRYVPGIIHCVRSAYHNYTTDLTGY
ncbi:unnamed protein product, partial [Rotaria sp. Silwood1]